jgi:uncharacterized protein YndB with AHSA1/START domain
MPEFTITRQIDAPVEKVWEVLNDFGAIASWNPGVKRSALTSDGPVAEGSTRHCDFAPLGGVDERIDVYVPNEHMRVDLFETFKLPIDGAVADFRLAPKGEGAEVVIHYEYTLNRLGRLAKGQTDKQLRKGLGGLADSLVEESNRVAVS